MPHIFISYSHKDEEYAQQLTELIKKKGFEVWRDDRIGTGSNWLKTIEEFLDTCTVFLVIMSAHSRASNWVQNELTRAQRLNKPIIPLLFEGEPWLSVETIQYIDVRDKQLPNEIVFEDLAKYMVRSSHLDFIYFSTQPDLTYQINEKYFNGEHNVYCTKEFSSPAPTSGSPSIIYETLLDIAEMDDRGSSFYWLQKKIIKDLAEKKCAEKLISEATLREIRYVVENAKTADLRPVVYLIDSRLTRERMMKVVQSEPAIVKVEEYFIIGLKSHEFQIMRPIARTRLGL